MVKLTTVSFYKRMESLKRALKLKRVSAYKQKASINLKRVSIWMKKVSVYMRKVSL